MSTDTPIDELISDIIHRHALSERREGDHDAAVREIVATFFHDGCNVPGDIACGLAFDLGMEQAKTEGVMRPLIDALLERQEAELAWTLAVAAGLRRPIDGAMAAALDLVTDEAIIRECERRELIVLRRNLRGNYVARIENIGPEHESVLIAQGAGPSEFAGRLQRTDALAWSFHPRGVADLGYDITRPPNRDAPTSSAQASGPTRPAPAADRPSRRKPSSSSRAKSPSRRR